MKKNTLLAILSIFSIALLVLSQVAWVQLLVKRDKERFEMELRQTLQSIVSFCLSKDVSNDLDRLSFMIKPATQEDITSGAVIRGSFDTQEYHSDKNLGNFLVGSFAEDLLAENKIRLEPMDSLFRKTFAHYREIAAYSMHIQKNDSTMRELYDGKSAKKALADSTAGATVLIPLGQSGAYTHKTHVVFKPTVFTQRLRSVSAISAVAVIVIAMLLTYQLFRLRRQGQKLTSHKKAATGIVHDLKSPLAYVYTQLGVFEQSETDAEKKKKFYISKIRVKYLTDKMDTLLSFLKNNHSGTLQLNIHPYPLTSRCREIMDELRVIYRNKQIEFSIEPSEDITLTADPVYFDSCVRNLLDNAVKYSGDSPIIQVSVMKRENNLRITFRDNGKGVSPENKKKIFKEFYRANKNSSVKSHGVGLAFTQQIVRAHSGKILFDSVPDKGSVVTIVLPQ